MQENMLSYLKAYVFTFCILIFLSKYLCIDTYACEKSPQPHKISYFEISNIFSVKFIPLKFYIWTITKKIL
jgi:hypothetical protein